MNILEKIIARKHEEISESKKQRSVSDLEKAPLFSRPTASLATALRSSTSPEGAIVTAVIYLIRLLFYN